MASEVDICNLALGHLGDAANLQSIDPPDGSAQADHCARFYPMARDTLLDMHAWNFATKRITLAQLSTCPASTWAYAYAAPSDMVSALAVLDPAATDDIIAGTQGTGDSLFFAAPPTVPGVVTPQPYQVEALDDDTTIILTNQAGAVLRYVAGITDTTKFSPLFVRVLAASLASLLAGPVLKGDAGATASARWEAIAFGRDGKSGLFARAAESDAAQRRTTMRDQQTASWIAGR